MLTSKPPSSSTFTILEAVSFPGHLVFLEALQFVARLSKNAVKLVGDFPLDG